LHACRPAGRPIRTIFDLSRCDALAERTGQIDAARPRGQQIEVAANSDAFSGGKPTMMSGLRATMARPAPPMPVASAISTPAAARAGPGGQIIDPVAPKNDTSTTLADRGSRLLMSWRCRPI